MRIEDAKKLKVGDVVRVWRYSTKDIVITDITIIDEKHIKFACEDFTFSHKEIIKSKNNS